MFDPLDQAIYSLVHDFPGGAVKLAARVNMNSGTLNNKTNPSMESHHLTLKEAVLLMLTTRDFRLLHSICLELGFACVETGDVDGVGDVEFLNQFSASMAEVGQLSQAINDAFKDGRITLDEVNRVRKEALDAIAALARLPKRMEGMSDG